MCRISWIAVGLLAIAAGSAEARQSATTPKWDVAASVGLFSASPVESEEPYGNWYFEGRYGISVGRYWTEHLKTEVELATTNEGSRYSVRNNSTVPGVPLYYPVTANEYFGNTQLSGRVVWQFLENTWVHPYVFGGVALEAQRYEAFIPQQFYYPDTRTPETRIEVMRETRIGPETNFRAAGVAGVGAKVYMTKRAFFNTAFVASYAKPSRTVSFIGGFGVDF